MTIYNVINWVNDAPPPINASNLNYMDEGIRSAHVEIASQAVEVASMAAYASTLYQNISANGSAIAANTVSIFGVEATQAALSSQLYFVDLTLTSQTAAVASNTQAVASLLPAVNYHSSQIAELYATQGAHSSSLFEIAATQADHDLQLFGLSATQGQLVSITGGQATTLSQHSTQIYELQQQATAVGGSLVYMNRTGNGPVDLWVDADPVQVTATGGEPRAIGIKYVPAASLTLASGVADFTIELLANEGVASAPLEFSGCVLGPTGMVEAWFAPTSIPAVATSSVVEAVSVPLETSDYVMQAGVPHYLVLASDDAYSFSVLGQGAVGEAAGIVRWNRGLAYEWELTGGLDLASYVEFPLSVASSIMPNTYPAMFVNPE